MALFFSMYPAYFVELAGSELGHELYVVLYSYVYVAV